MSASQTPIKQDNTGKLPKWAIALISSLVILFLIQSGLFFLFLAKKHASPNDQGTLISSESRSPSFHKSNAATTQRTVKSSRQGQRSPWNDPFVDDPFFAMGRFHDRMNQMFQSLMTYSSPGFFGDRVFDYMPTVDIEDQGKDYKVYVDLPGLDKSKINITIRGNLLTIQGVRETSSISEDDEGDFFAQERSYGTFARTINLPGLVDETNIRTQYLNGVLTITLPKLDEASSLTKIAIQ